MIIRSLLDTDLYKLTMQMAVCQLYPKAKVKYQFFNRGGTKFPPGFDYLLRQEIAKMTQLQLHWREKDFLRKNCYYLTDFYLDFLEGYRFNPDEVGVILDNGELKITIEGYWYRTILWEVPLMAIISELYFEVTGKSPNSLSKQIATNFEKAFAFQQKGAKVADFGSRRRYSYDAQLQVCKDFQSYFDSDDWFVGTSNPHIAMELGLTPLGTFAHEWVSGIAALKGYTHANQISMEDWSQVYEGNLGIALPDTFGLDAFLVDFDTKYAKLFDGVRHDSGDPFEFTDKIVAHYKKLRIDPLSKVIIFSDGLNTDMVLRLTDHCKGKIKCSFGIGTNLTNDVGVTPLNMVIKLVLINSIPVIKLSDNSSKSIGDPKTIESVKYLLNQHQI